MNWRDLLYFSKGERIALTPTLPDLYILDHFVADRQQTGIFYR